MGYLPFVLLWGLPQIWENSEGSSDLHSLPASPRFFPLRCLQISSFANSSWTRTDGLGWVGELQAYTWRNDSDTIVFLKPWSQGTLSDQLANQLQHIFKGYRSSFTRDIREFVKMLGSDSPDAPPWMQRVCRVLNEDQGTKETVQWLLYDICPQFVRGVLETGKSELEKQVKPEAWLSSGPTPGPGRLLLVCHVSGFYPKPVWVMWMRGEQEQPGTQQGDILPHADGTWYLRVTLDVAAGEASGLSCRVKHSSLGDQDIILYWADHSHVLVIVLSVLAFILVLGGSFAFWFRRRRVYQNIQ
ncbi:antigen-presenting glycoprotein CD1d isoform X4 [Sus scrofa]|uniref:antigen-presenting glycoprotein CD1d isoform X4 n=1 Tax=Sus scrofa TaxID=9823 RepID=UPI0003AEC2B6|nr:antigen-presenting glycoprotein CD1d isoform X4 [Sus scrofa]